MNHRFDIVVVGTGHAGYTFARLLRKETQALSVLLVTADDGAMYSKPMLSNGLSKNKTAAQLAVQSADDMASALNATLLTHTRVNEIDTARKVVATNNNDYNEIEYESLILAVGAQQIKLPIAGEAADEIITVNDLDDYARFRELLDPVDRVAVMGPGLIGCEFANDLASVGKTTIIIGPDTRPLERLIPAEASAALKRAMDSLGVEWHLETVVNDVQYSDNGYRLHLNSGAQVDAGLIVSAAGLRPNLELATSAGIATNLGIVVNRQLRTSNPDIYAIGDCAEVEGKVLPYIMPVMHAAKALVATLIGDATDVVYPAMPVVIKTPVHPIVIAPPPDENIGQWQVETDGEGVRAEFRSVEGALTGFVLTGAYVKEKVRLERQLPALLA